MQSQIVGVSRGKKGGVGHDLAFAELTVGNETWEVEEEWKEKDFC